MRKGQKNCIPNFTPNVSIITVECSIVFTGILSDENLKVIVFFLYLRSQSFRLLHGERKVQYFEPFGSQEM